MRACLNPPPKSTGTNRMEYHLLDEVVLIGCQHRTDSMQPEQDRFLGRGRKFVSPLFLQEDRTARPNGPTERAQIKSCLVDIDITTDGGGCVLRTNSLLLCRGTRERSSFVLIWLARPKILDGHKHGFFPRNGTNGHEQPRSVPSGAARSNRIKTRPDTPAVAHVI